MKLIVLSSGLLALGLSTTMTVAIPVFADKKDCDKNDNNNCNDTKKNQKLSPKAECEIDTKIEDHSKKNDVGPTNLQCDTNK